ncbi:hypothetical protein [Allosediminivita pacifica]|uniref:Lipoprotein n=1 Tax=Allosediminivita pacifica TaxID=1267769 RepID=A0A2T6B3S2_9RHOB|nr:hypothetical protein [Allosediminivita pacifica]PTX50704.1 hypothetical protein C8N44_10459 [Allosediminivita pacifica]GGB00515.1 hypothetical protein GCM10011324_08500 [Allosediminivita pacifica]
MRALAFILALTAAGPAVALSCMQADPQADFRRAAADDRSWIVVDGEMRFDEDLLPKTDLGAQAPRDAVEIPARIEGQGLSKEGFTIPFDRDITLRATCAGPWCASPASDTRYLAFLLKEGDGYVALASPCPGNLHPNPAPEALDAVQTCMQGGPCAER